MYCTMTVKTHFGPLLLSADRHGLTSILLPGARAGKKHITSGNLPPDATCLALAGAQIREYFTGGRTEFDLPISPNGTVFQKQVWTIMRDIPYGQTMTYGEIARMLGGTGKARAVGGAAHANPLPLIIPCHRVIGSDGSLTGFASGLRMKERLLELEKKYLLKTKAA